MGSSLESARGENLSVRKPAEVVKAAIVDSLDSGAPPIMSTTRGVALLRLVRQDAGRCGPAGWLMHVYVCSGVDSDTRYELPEQKCLTGNPRHRLFDERQAGAIPVYRLPPSERRGEQR